ncbi:MAG TPA: PstS family phosphate ABC transporter substrate-binding protein [Planctomycetes bacterium]|nr:PstS family phosphate ABC transporter substrate-binding protein [Planctomycetota bacterium]
MNLRTLLIVGALTGLVSAQQALPEYKATEGISGTIKSVGSDTMNNLMTLWGEGFRRFYPNVSIEIEGKGSGTAPPALIQGVSNFGPMSRKMKKKEMDVFEKRFGYKPTPLPTSIDMLAVYVNKDNPIQGMTLAEVDAVFSKTRKRGHGPVRTWGDLALPGRWAAQPISLYGRNNASGTYGYFKKIALGKGDYKDEVKAQPGSSAVVQGVATDKFGIGYSGIGYKTADVRAIPLARDRKSPMIPPTTENVSRYPLARFLYLYVNKNPKEDLDPLRREFIRYVFSRQGQEAVTKDGYIPVSRKIAAKALASVGLALEAGETSSLR